MSDVAFKPLSEAEQLFKDLIWTPAIAAGKLVLEGHVPFLSAPIIHPIETEAVKLLTDWMFEQLRMLIDVEAIKLVDAAHQAAFETASLKLKVVLAESGLHSAEFQKAKDDAKAALS